MFAHVVYCVACFTEGGHHVRLQKRRSISTRFHVCSKCGRRFVRLEFIRRSGLHCWCSGDRLCVRPSREPGSQQSGGNQRASGDPHVAAGWFSAQALNSAGFTGANYDASLTLQVSETGRAKRRIRIRRSAVRAPSLTLRRWSGRRALGPMRRRDRSYRPSRRCRGRCLCRLRSMPSAPRRPACA